MTKLVLSNLDSERQPSQDCHFVIPKHPLLHLLYTALRLDRFDDSQEHQQKEKTQTDQDGFLLIQTEGERAEERATDGSDEEKNRGWYIQ